MTTTLQPIRRAVTTVEVTIRDIDVLERILFAAMVDVIRELHKYDDSRIGQDYAFEARMERETIRTLQTKLEQAREQIREAKK